MSKISIKDKKLFRAMRDNGISKKKAKGVLADVRGSGGKESVMGFIQWLPSRAASSTCASTSGQRGPTGAGYDVVMTEQERDLTEKAGTGLGAFAEAGTIRA